VSGSSLESLKITDVGHAARDVVRLVVLESLVLVY
jgi:hypothetical protein